VPIRSTVKQRPIPAKGPDARFEKVDTPKSGPSVTTRSNVAWNASSLHRLWKGIQITESESHPGWAKAQSGDVGGNFRTQKRWLETDVKSVMLSGTASTTSLESFARYWGPVLACSATNAPLPPYSQSANHTLDSLGATAVARCKPTNSVADLSVALGELIHQGLPTVPTKQTWERIRDQTDRARRAGSEYLNAEFGWRPLLSELGDFGLAVTRSDEILNQYERDAGRMVRRQFRFAPERNTTTTTLISGSASPYMAIISSIFNRDGAVPKGDLIRTRTTYKRRWFSGAFVYNLPRGYYSRNQVARYAARASILYGAELTPSTVWNLSPWSWAVDWFSNIGDVLSNVSDWATDGMVMKYGYIMEHSLIRDTYTYYGDTGLETPVVPQAVTLVSETKVRRQANPFGFGVTWEGLSPRQIAIAIALGLTKGRRS